MTDKKKKDNILKSLKFDKIPLYFISIHISDYYNNN